MIEFGIAAVPEAPNDLETQEVTWESVELKWHAGFNGGYAQNFLVSYMDSNTVETVSVGSLTHYNVTHLYPDINYTFRVVSENEVGTGSPSNAVAAETPGTYPQLVETITSS